MRDTSQKPTLHALVKLHAELGGKIFDNRKQAAKLAKAMKHVEAVIRLLDPEYDVRRIVVRRRYKGNQWFKRGTLLRLSLDVLRKAEGPLTARQITEALLAAKGVTNVKAVRELIPSIQISLRKYRGRSVATVGEERPTRWRLA